MNWWEVLDSPQNIGAIFKEDETTSYYPSLYPNRQQNLNQFNNGENEKELLKSAPWRDAPEDGDDKFQEARLKVSSEPGTIPTMHVPGKKVYYSETDGIGENSLSEIDPELRYSFQRNFQFLQHVFSVDTVVKPLPPSVAYNVSRNLTFFTRIFTQFFDPDGIADAQKSLWLGQEEKVRKVR
ncbi:uncharacterized protein [Primulina eburnea]|uniref:uncharacterized protein n=1 Tax=Primulina eburnea TaxID=1245227 RepID=UPI003C6C1C83